MDVNQACTVLQNSQLQCTRVQAATSLPTNQVGQQTPAAGQPVPPNTVVQVNFDPATGYPIYRYMGTHQSWIVCIDVRQDCTSLPAHGFVQPSLLGYAWNDMKSGSAPLYRFFKQLTPSGGGSWINSTTLPAPPGYDCCGSFTRIYPPDPQFAGPTRVMLVRQMRADGACFYTVNQAEIAPHVAMGYTDVQNVGYVGTSKTG
jgi:hypothetical protein